jgi:chromosome segregation ATPase
MAINPNREAARLTKFKKAGEAVTAEIEQIKGKLLNLAGDLDQLMVRETLEENAITELNGQLMAASAREDKTDEVVAEIARLTNEVAQHTAAKDAIVDEYAVKHTERGVLQNQLHALETGPTMTVIKKQEEALKRKEASYPAKLKVHLRKARKHGWADARLTTKK